MQKSPAKLIRPLRESERGAALESPSPDRRLTGGRVLVWAVAWCLSWALLRDAYPLAWQVAAFGALFPILWTLVNRQPRRVGVNRGEPAPEASAPAPKADPRFEHLLAIGIDIGLITLLIHVTGGFRSIFAPLLFVGVGEAFALLGAQAAIYTALASALFSLIHLRLPAPREAVLLYGLAVGAMLVSALLVGLRQGAAFLRGEAMEEPGDALFGNASRKAHSRALALLEMQVEEQAAANRHLKAMYSEVAQLHREQKTQLERLRAAERLHEIALSACEEEGAAQAALLGSVMEFLEAGGAVLWLRSADGEHLAAAACAGRISPSLKENPISGARALPAREIRRLCEDALLACASNGRPSPARSADGPAAQGEEGDAEPIPTGHRPQPALAVVLREPGAVSDIGSAILGAIGVCEPRGASRFSQADQERLQALAPSLAVALQFLARQKQMQRKSQEMTLLYELSRLVQTAQDMDEIFHAVVEAVQQAVPLENCTLFLLDKAHNRLEPKAMRGRVVNLLEHIAFEKGPGVSGWVAGKGRQLLIPDLAEERNLLHVERIPPRIRSFAAIPLRVQENVVGVLTLSHSRPNAFSPDDIQLLAILAGQAALTIERTEVLHIREAQAHTDGLTQVFNRRYFHERLAEELKRGERYQLPCALLLADADDFKQIHERIGPVAGDLVLQELASVLKRSVRETEVVARYGGEAFALLLPQTDARQAAFAAERIRSLVARHPFRTPSGNILPLTVSIGVAACPQQAQEPESLIAAADRALAAARGQGRNRVCIAQAPGGDEEAPPRLRYSG